MVWACSFPLGGTHGCNFWPSRGLNRLSLHVAFVVGEGNHAQFQHDCWARELPLKSLFPNLFECTMDKDVFVYDVLGSQ